ncbi:hypothetical protein [Herbiconiux sp. A18JL235]|uniref:Uncharacterized protein n=1 Tax=Herbiconiux sp. A18JL235 TaxID=3152363 RepID=A0AB39BC06_9MICO
MSRTTVAPPPSLRAVGVGVVLACAIALSGCSGLPSAVAPSAAKTSPSVADASSTPAAEAPWSEGTGPVAAIEFELDGTASTLLGTFEPGGLLSCTGDIVTIANTSPAPGLGVTFSAADEPAPLVSSWVVGDELVAQFTGSGEVVREEHPDGSIGYTVIGAEGRASVLPRDPAAAAIGDYDMKEARQVDAVSSFTVTCPVG